jgi:hypothetical protein
MAAPLFVGGYARATEDFRSIEGIHTWLARSGG